MKKIILVVVGVFLFTSIANAGLLGINLGLKGGFSNYSFVLNPDIMTMLPVDTTPKSAYSAGLLLDIRTLPVIDILIDGSADFAGYEELQLNLSLKQSKRILITPIILFYGIGGGINTPYNFYSFTYSIHGLLGGEINIPLLPVIFSLEGRYKVIIEPHQSVYKYINNISVSLGVIYKLL